MQYRTACWTQGHGLEMLDPAAMPDLDTTAWYAFGIPAYVLYVVVEIALAHRRREKTFGFAETISNLTCGLGTLTIGLFVGPHVQAAWDFAHDHVAPFRWPLHGAWKLPAAVVLADFCYYVYHRAGHRFALFWSIHGVHHQHEHLNSSVGFRLEWLADPYAALFFGLMPLCGVDSTTGFFAILLLSAYTLTAHSPTMRRPTFGFLVTPATHGSHHSRDSRYAGKNYGAMLGIWDRLFGTWLEPPPGDTLRADIPSISRMHDGVSTQLGLIRELLAQLSGRPMRERLRVLLSPPIALGPKTPLREDAELSRPTRVYVLVSFLMTTALGGWLLWLRNPRPFGVELVVALTVLSGLYTTGGLLDGRRRAVVDERARLVFTALVGVGLLAYSSPLGVALAVAALLGLASSTTLTVPRDARIVDPAE